MEDPSQNLAQTVQGGERDRQRPEGKSTKNERDYLKREQLRTFHDGSNLNDGTVDIHRTYKKFQAE